MSARCIPVLRQRPRVDPAEAVERLREYRSPSILESTAGPATRAAAEARIRANLAERHPPLWAKTEQHLLVDERGG